MDLTALAAAVPPAAGKAKAPAIKDAVQKQAPAQAAKKAAASAAKAGRDDEEDLIAADEGGTVLETMRRPGD